MNISKNASAKLLGIGAKLDSRFHSLDTARDSSQQFGIQLRLHQNKSWLRRNTVKACKTLNIAICYFCTLTKRLRKVSANSQKIGFKSIKSPAVNRKPKCSAWSQKQYCGNYSEHVGPLKMKCRSVSGSSILVGIDN